jgi:bifunctional ADP-heptose synthase (sugar kinase/adenylyltransferase)
LNDRMRIVAALEIVDHVLSFRETDVRRVLETLRPDFHCKGTDYTEETVPESSWARHLGIETRIVGDPKDHSTRDWIRRVSNIESG